MDTSSLSDTQFCQIMQKRPTGSFSDPTFLPILTQEVNFNVTHAQQEILLLNHLFIIYVSSRYSHQACLFNANLT